MGGSQSALLADSISDWWSLAGVDALVATVVKGKGAMPPKAGNASLADADIKAAVEHMLASVK